jgi:uncharacterized protein (DUF2267 family)
MSATGLDAFDKTLQTTNIWLDEIMAEVGPDRQTAWHVLSVVLRTLRDRVPLGLAAHLGAQLPLLVRGTYYDHYFPFRGPTAFRTEQEFFDCIQKQLADDRPVNPRNAATGVFGVLSRHVSRGQIEKVRDALPGEIQRLWDVDAACDMSVTELTEVGRKSQNAADARAFQARPKGQRRRTAG